MLNKDRLLARLRHDLSLAEEDLGKMLAKKGALVIELREADYALKDQRDFVEYLKSRTEALYNEIYAPDTQAP